ncbi:hypothetical protein R1sor_002000 [Riccia sorocarpa]|uniref:Uncharacterized protein n=1 Tax=Riccia sorocarpa TaxID=122646 RepID=A0ABD3GYD0_9MARC
MQRNSSRAGWGSGTLVAAQFSAWHAPCTELVYGAGRLFSRQQGPLERPRGHAADSRAYFSPPTWSSISSFWYALWNTDADGDRLLIKGTGGSTCVVGWHEVSVAFGASHGEAKEFRAIKINNKNFAQYRPGEYLPETVETNAQRKLVNGQPYEEISYYKEAAPYGATYFLMTIICVLFWCNGRSTRFTTPMVYAYMRSIHGFSTNWAKMILHCLKIEICFLQKRARSPDNTKVTPIVWAPVFLRILYAFRSTVFAGTQLATPDAWVPWVHMTKEGEIDLKGLHAKFPATIEDIKLIRESCKLSDKIPIAEPVVGAPSNGNAALVPSKMPARKRARDVQVYI